MEFLPAPDRLDPPVGELHVWRLGAPDPPLRQVLATYLGGDPEQIQLERGEHGKPRLAETDRRLEFNLSHSGELALVAVSAELEVGIDVEWVRGDRDAVALAERALSAADVAAVRAASDEERAAAFHQRWARHEARLKCLGIGLSQGNQEGAEPIAVADLEIDPGYAAAVAVAAPELPQLRWWTLGLPLHKAG